MNTQYIKKKAIAKALGELLEDTCLYSPDSQSRDDSMEPDVTALSRFSTMISDMAKLHFLNELEIEDVQFALDFCYEIGLKVGHVFWGNCMTGTWGVRIGKLENIKKIINVGDFDIVGVGDAILILDKYDAEIEKITIGVNWVWLKVEFTNEYGYVEKFEIDYNWNKIDDLRKV